MLPGPFGTDPWFEPKKLGYGSGLPCAWQGWALLGGYLGAILILAAFKDRLGLMVFLVGFAAVTLPFVWLVRRHTRGGWRWRNGD